MSTCATVEAARPGFRTGHPHDVSASSAATLLGLGGAKRNACAAVCVDGDVRAVCEQERLTRVRGVGLLPRALPSEAVDEVLALAGRRRDHVTSFVVAEPVVLPSALPSRAVGHHQAHAATAFLTSPFDRAAVIVCDSSVDQEMSVWLGDGWRLHDRHWPWRGPGFATLYAECARLFDFGEGRDVHHLEALAHLGGGGGADCRLDALWQYADGRLVVAPDWQASVADMVRDARQRSDHGDVDLASALQCRLATLLLEFVADVRRTLECEALCVGGGLFFNTYFNSRLREAGLFSRVFVPINPGNAGLAPGAALMVAPRDGSARPATGLSPFLGPEYDRESIKETLDGCKLSYSFVSENEAIDETVDTLVRGQLVGWFQGRMEWGPRALGHRSILASPLSPYVLENLNVYLRKRERWRAFGLSASAAVSADLFRGPAASPFMEYEYALRDDRLRHVMPPGAASVRVHTVDAQAGIFATLLDRMAQATGIGALVNTSLNGFHEPIACSPRDAVRVFYGTGLDMLVMDRFILRK